MRSPSIRASTRACVGVSGRVRSLAVAKRRVGTALGSWATAEDGTQNMLCAYLSGALLVGLGANTLFGWWWADPAVALFIGVVAVKEGMALWRGESCGCCVEPVSPP